MHVSEFWHSVTKPIHRIASWNGKNCTFYWYSCKEAFGGYLQS